MNAKLTGIITDIFPTDTKPNFSKKVFWLKQPDTERYPQQWEIELHQLDIRYFKGIQIGDTVEVEVEIRGRKWENQSRQQKIFMSLKCVGLKMIEQMPKATSKIGSYVPKKRKEETDDDRHDPGDAQQDLPF